MRLISQIRRYLAPNAIYRQLYPAPSVPIHFRPYEARDRDRVLHLHDSNAPGRFPENHRPVFEEFLDTDSETLFIAETKDSQIAACCGVNATGTHVNTLCYGLVAKEYQGYGIGSCMTLARLAFATRAPGTHFSIIYALPKPMSFYSRFGYTAEGEWEEGDGSRYPIGILVYDSSSIRQVERVLKQRGHIIDPSYKLSQIENENIIVQQDERGVSSFEMRPKQLET